MPLLYYDTGIVSRPCRDLRTIDLYAFTLFVGDLHTTGVRGDSERFLRLAEYVKARSVSNVVVLGDLFAWRSDFDSLLVQLRDQKEVVKMVLDVLGLLDKRLTVYLVLGDPSHDPQELNVNLDFAETKFLSVGKCGIFHINGLTIIGLHADEAFRGLFSFAVSILTRNLLLERLWKEWMRIPSDTWVVMAHIHVPGIDYAAKVANTGARTETPLISTPRAMGIAVDEQGGIKLTALR